MRKRFPLKIRKHPSGETFWIEVEPSFDIARCQQEIHKLREIPETNIRLSVSIETLEAHNLPPPSQGGTSEAFFEQTLSSLGLVPNHHASKTTTPKTAAAAASHAAAAASPELCLELAPITLYVQTPTGPCIALEQAVDAEATIESIRDLVVETLAASDLPEAQEGSKKPFVLYQKNHENERKRVLRNGTSITHYRLKNSDVLNLEFGEYQDTKNTSSSHHRRSLRRSPSRRCGSSSTHQSSSSRKAVSWSPIRDASNESNAPVMRRKLKSSHHHRRDPSERSLHTKTNGGKLTKLTAMTASPPPTAATVKEDSNNGHPTSGSKKRLKRSNSWSPDRKTTEEPSPAWRKLRNFMAGDDNQESSWLELDITQQPQQQQPHEKEGGSKDEASAPGDGTEKTTGSSRSSSYHTRLKKIQPPLKTKRRTNSWSPSRRATRNREELKQKLKYFLGRGSRDKSHWWEQFQLMSSSDETSSLPQAQQSDTTTTTTTDHKRTSLAASPKQPLSSRKKHAKRTKSWSPVRASASNEEEEHPQPSVTRRHLKKSHRPRDASLKSTQSTHTATTPKKKKTHRTKSWSPVRDGATEEPSLRRRLKKSHRDASEKSKASHATAATTTSKKKKQKKPKRTKSWSPTRTSSAEEEEAPVLRRKLKSHSSHSSHNRDASEKSKSTHTKKKRKNPKRRTKSWSPARNGSLEEPTTPLRRKLKTNSSSSSHHRGASEKSKSTHNSTQKKKKNKAKRTKSWSPTRSSNPEDPPGWTKTTKEKDGLDVGINEDGSVSHRSRKNNTKKLKDLLQDTSERKSTRSTRSSIRSASKKGASVRSKAQQEIDAEGSRRSKSPSTRGEQPKPPKKSSTIDRAIGSTLEEIGERRRKKKRRSKIRNTGDGQDHKYSAERSRRKTRCKAAPKKGKPQGTKKKLPQIQNAMPNLPDEGSNGSDEIILVPLKDASARSIPDYWLDMHSITHQSDDEEADIQADTEEKDDNVDVQADTHSDSEEVNADKKDPIASSPDCTKTKLTQRTEQSRVLSPPSVLEEGMTAMRMSILMDESSDILSEEELEEVSVVSHDWQTDNGSFSDAEFSYEEYTASDSKYTSYEEYTYCSEDNTVGFDEPNQMIDYNVTSEGNSDGHGHNVTGEKKEADVNDVTQADNNRGDHDTAQPEKGNSQKKELPPRNKSNSATEIDANDENSTACTVSTTHREADETPSPRNKKAILAAAVAFLKQEEAIPNEIVLEPNEAAHITTTTEVEISRDSPSEVSPNGNTSETIPKTNNQDALAKFDSMVMKAAQEKTKDIEERPCNKHYTELQTSRSPFPHTIPEMLFQIRARGRSNPSKASNEVLSDPSDEESAIKLQALVRGYLARCRFVRKIDNVIEGLLSKAEEERRRKVRDLKHQELEKSLSVCNLLMSAIEKHVVDDHSDPMLEDDTIHSQLCLKNVDQYHKTARVGGRLCR